MTRPAYSIGTLVTNRQQYAEMRQSFEERGFGGCEFLTIDNSQGNVMDAYDGLNELLNRARGRYVILCHQDVFLVDDRREDLDRVLDELTRRDAFWAVAGNAGCSGYRQPHFYITDNFGDYRAEGLPRKVTSLDENFLIVRPETRVAFSRDIGGFHMYGTDICMHAEILGYSAWVVPFHLYHAGEGNTGKSFKDCKAAFQRKWRHALRHRLIQTSVTRVMITGANCPKWYASLKFRLLKLRTKLGLGA